MSCSVAGARESLVDMSQTVKTTGTCKLCSHPIDDHHFETHRKAEKIAVASKPCLACQEGSRGRCAV